MSALNPSVRLVRSKGLPNPNRYVLAMNGEYSDWVVNEEEAPSFKGTWRESLGLETAQPLDLEIGTGNGYFFAHYGSTQPTRNLLGMELKFKPLIQTIKRSLSHGNKNTWAVRYHAGLLNELFAAEEINNVFIFFPDPWPKTRHHKNRLITSEFLNLLYRLQKPGSYIDFKTDHADYFDWVTNRVPSSPYKIERSTRDLHLSEWAAENFQTHFEKLWTSKGLKTHYLRLRK